MSVCLVKPLTDNLLELHPAGIVFGDEVIQSVPTPTNSHHHVVPQDLKIEHRYQEVEEESRGEDNLQTVASHWSCYNWDLFGNNLDCYVIGSRWMYIKELQTTLVVTPIFRRIPQRCVYFSSEN